MKNYLTVLMLTTLATTAFGQSGEERDYGELLPEEHFIIKHSKTTLKDSADITNYQINSTPKKDEYVYKVNSVKTPRGGMFAKKKDFKLTVERDEGKLTRFSSVSFTDNDKKGVESIQTTSLQTNGYLNSHTNCYDNFKKSLFGVKKSEDGFKCVTVNAAVCEYLAKSEIDEAMVEKINSCSDVLAKLGEHQKYLYDISKQDLKKDLSALSKIHGRVGDAKNFYELDAKTLKDVAEIVSGYGSAVAQCEFLKENAYLEPKHIPGDREEDFSGNSGSSAKDQ